MDETIRCQSCGMPLGPGYYGTDKFGNDNKDYCTYCFKNGNFTEPNLTVEGMVEKSVVHMVKELRFEEKEARDIAESFIPKLKRWNQ